MVFSDAQAEVLKINSSCVPANENRDLVSDIKLLCNQLNVFSVNYMLRDCNRVANVLARFSLNCSSFFILNRSKSVLTHGCCIHSWLIKLQHLPIKRKKTEILICLQYNIDKLITLFK